MMKEEVGDWMKRWRVAAALYPEADVLAREGERARADTPCGVRGGIRT